MINILGFVLRCRMHERKESELLFCVLLYCKDEVENDSIWFFHTKIIVGSSNNDDKHTKRTETLKTENCAASCVFWHTICDNKCADNVLLLENFYRIIIIL